MTTTFRSKVALALAGLLLSCTDDDATVRTLRMHGFTDIRTTGYSFFVCGEHDTFATGFTAKNPAGQVVQGTVCCGLVAKGCTVRL